MQVLWEPDIRSQGISKGSGDPYPCRTSTARSDHERLSNDGPHAADTKIILHDLSARKNSEFLGVGYLLRVVEDFEYPLYHTHADKRLRMIFFKYAQRC